MRIHKGIVRLLHSRPSDIEQYLVLERMPETLANFARKAWQSKKTMKKDLFRCLMTHEAPEQILLQCLLALPSLPCKMRQRLRHPLQDQVLVDVAREGVEEAYYTPLNPHVVEGIEACVRFRLLAAIDSLQSKNITKRRKDKFLTISSLAPAWRVIILPSRCNVTKRTF